MGSELHFIDESGVIFVRPLAPMLSSGSGTTIGLDIGVTGSSVSFDFMLCAVSIRKCLEIFSTFKTWAPGVSVLSLGGRFRARGQASAESAS